MRTKVNTDRCFLLLNDVEINVSNCTTGGSGATATGGRGSNACGDIFRFVSVSNPEYYTEFSAVSMQEIQTQEQTQAEKENPRSTVCLRKPLMPSMNWPTASKTLTTATPAAMATLIPHQPILIPETGLTLPE